MSKVASILAMFILACAKLPDGEDDAADSASDGDSEETSDGSDLAPCGPMPADFVCVLSDSEVDLDSVCIAAYRCWAICSGTICEDEEESECDENHAAFYAAEPSQSCIDLLIAAETCHFGLACGELGESSCDPEQPCYPAWLDFHEAGCDTTVGIGPGCSWD